MPGMTRRSGRAPGWAAAGRPARPRSRMGGPMGGPMMGGPPKASPPPVVVTQRKSSAIRIVNPESKEEVKGDFKKPEVPEAARPSAPTGADGSEASKKDPMIGEGGLPAKDTPLAAAAAAGGGFDRAPPGGYGAAYGVAPGKGAEGTRRPTRTFKRAREPRAGYRGDPAEAVGGPCGRVPRRWTRGSPRVRPFRSPEDPGDTYAAAGGSSHAHAHAHAQAMRAAMAAAGMTPPPGVTTQMTPAGAPPPRPAGARGAPAPAAPRTQRPRPRRRRRRRRPRRRLTEEAKPSAATDARGLNAAHISYSACAGRAPAADAETRCARCARSSELRRARGGGGGA